MYIAIAIARSLTQAYRADLHYPGHLIILMGWYLEDWWMMQTEDLNCSAEERESIMNYALAVHHFNFLIPEDVQTTSGIV